MSVTYKLNTSGAKAFVQAERNRLKKRIAQEVATEGQARAPQLSGFLASTIGATGPGEQGVPARDELTPHGRRQSAATRAAGPDEALVYIAAIYAVFIITGTSTRPGDAFMWDAVQAVRSRLGQIAQEERRG